MQIILPILLIFSVSFARAGQTASDTKPGDAPQEMSRPQSSDVGASLEPRMNERNFVRDILERLHALDADIGKLIYNSTSMYSPDDTNSAFKENLPDGGERFSEVLSDLDSLQDEVSNTSKH